MRTIQLITSLGLIAFALPCFSAGAAKDAPTAIKYTCNAGDHTLELSVEHGSKKKKIKTRLLSVGKIEEGRTHYLNLQKKKNDIDLWTAEFPDGRPFGATLTIKSALELDDKDGTIVDVRYATDSEVDSGIVLVRPSNRPQEEWRIKSGLDCKREPILSYPADQGLLKEELKR